MVSSLDLDGDVHAGGEIELLQLVHGLGGGIDDIEQRTHKRLLDIIDPTAKTVDELKKLNLPAGVDITIKI